MSEGRRRKTPKEEWRASHFPRDPGAECPPAMKTSLGMQGAWDAWALAMIPRDLESICAFIFRIARYNCGGHDETSAQHSAPAGADRGIRARGLFPTLGAHRDLPGRQAAGGGSGLRGRSSAESPD